MTIMQELVQYYKEFLKNRKLVNFDGRILCRYQMNDKEFLTLENLLNRIDLNNRDNLKTIIAPLFVLYTSESWRRNFAGAHWSWTTVLRNLNQGDLNNIRYAYVRKGFLFLKRELRITQNGTRYLGSIAIESGIPTQILENEQNNLTGVIKDIFKSLENTITNQDPVDLVRNIAINKLPETYHNDRFFLLLYDFSNALQSLSRKYQLEDQNNPIEYLDQNYPDWNNELPIVINQQNKNFFNTLLSDVAEIARAINNKLKVNYFLKNNGLNNSLHFNITIKNGIYLPEILGISSDDFNKLPNRFVLVQNIEGYSTHIGYFDKVGNGDKFRVENFNNDVAVSFNDDTFYYLSDFDDDIKIDLNLNVIDFKNNDAPLIFINDNNQWKLKAVGSAKIVECTYKILVTNANVLSQSNEQPFNPPKYKLFELDDKVSITNEDQSVFKITFSQTEDCNLFKWLKVHSGLQFSENDNKTIFVGFPHLLKYNSNGRFLGKYDSSELQIFINNNWIGVNNAPSICGRVKIRLCLNGVTEFSSWINILPNNFEFRIQQNRQEIILNNLPINSSISLENTNFTIHNNTLNYIGDQPGVTNLKLQSNNATKPVSIKIPLPIQGSFFTKKGVLLQNRAQLSINHLKGVRLCLFNLSNRQTNKTVTISLGIRDISISKRYLIDAYCSKEVSLLNLKDELIRLFSLENANDSAITIKSENQSLILRKYSSKPFFCIESNGYKFPINNREVNIFRLDQDFKIEKVKKLAVDENTQLMINEPTEGLHFIFSPDESENYFRPVLLGKKINAVNFDENTDFSEWNLSEISKINDINDPSRGYNLRRKAIKKRLKAISYDFSHDEWHNNIIPLSEYFKDTTLTLSSLDLWKHAAYSDTFLASLFFYLDNNFIYQFSNEFSVIWRKIAISKLKKSFDAYKSYFTQKFHNNTLLIDTIINQKIQLLEAFELGSIEAILSNENRPTNNAMLAILLPPELNELRLRHAENIWYNQINTEVSQWFTQCQLNKTMDKLLLNVLNAGNRFEYSIKYFPIILAYASVHNINLNNLEEPLLKYEVLKIRAFDSEWFNTIYDWFQSYFYAEQQAQIQLQTTPQ